MDERIDRVISKNRRGKKSYVLKAWNGLDYSQRFIFNKLIGGGFRIGVSYKLLVNALSKYSGVEESRMMHSIMGKWDPAATNYTDLIGGEHINADNSKPYPFCLAYPLDKPVEELGTPDEWQAEWKWDGIRGQIIKRNNDFFIWSRGEELVTEQFPELRLLADHLPDGIVIDGEILAVKDGQVLNFNQLQKRLNRKTISKKLLDETPAGFYVYDLLEYNANDIRGMLFQERRQLLEEIVEKIPFGYVLLSPLVDFDKWEQLAVLREEARDVNSEGIMLKAKNSIYHSGRKKGDWWKWKINPLSIDAVLIYAQKGSGRRSGFYTDYTFAIKAGDKLVTIAKAYSGLTDMEIKEVDKFIKNNSLEKFGPVRTVKPELVFEIGFEGIAESNRHKSGVALRFPRILRWRKDKKADEINTIEDLKEMLQKYG
ncbi:ATP-dependent DNA ligase [Niabella ginsengisoli]|uniref:DNA ligase (ATP) n=1 Tax=Niabella ginsengisoli TaxID=522298 RepID=A0ABS9SM25_9BACT|nr:ATP-dependent DNA ligase [Niabella ginsengisoli]MCH5599405.1 ATP-dependent DNA ligase [Niabella ginsengisoli]